MQSHYSNKWVAGEIFLLVSPRSKASPCWSADVEEALVALIPHSRTAYELCRALAQRTGEWRGPGSVSMKLKGLGCLLGTEARQLILDCERSSRHVGRLREDYLKREARELRVGLPHGDFITRAGAIRLTGRTGDYLRRRSLQLYISVQTGLLYYKIAEVLPLVKESLSNLASIAKTIRKHGGPRTRRSDDEARAAILFTAEQKPNIRRWELTRSARVSGQRARSMIECMVANGTLTEITKNGERRYSLASGRDGSGLHQPPSRQPVQKEKVAKLGIQREAGYLYFVKQGSIWKTPSRNLGRGGSTTLIQSGGFTQEDGWLYFLDANGDVSRTPKNTGGCVTRKAESRNHRLPQVAATKTAPSPARTNPEQLVLKPCDQPPKRKTTNGSQAASNGAREDPDIVLLHEAYAQGRITLDDAMRLIQARRAALSKTRQ